MLQGCVAAAALGWLRGTDHPDTRVEAAVPWRGQSTPPVVASRGKMDNVDLTTVPAPGSEEHAPGPSDLAEVGGEPQHAPLMIRVGRGTLDSGNKRLDAALPHVRFL